MLRSRAETMPVVTVPARPSGAPMAMVVSPTRRSAELPIGMGSSSPGAARETMARSPKGSVPTTVASLTVPSASRTVISGSEASPPSVTTCAVVSTCPWESSTMPEPLPAAEALLTERVTTEFEAASAARRSTPPRRCERSPSRCRCPAWRCRKRSRRCRSRPRRPRARSRRRRPPPRRRGGGRRRREQRRRETPPRRWRPARRAAGLARATSAGVGSAGRTSVRSSHPADRGWGPGIGRLCHGVVLSSRSPCCFPEHRVPARAKRPAAASAYRVRGILRPPG